MTKERSKESGGKKRKRERERKRKEKAVENQAVEGKMINNWYV